MKEEELKRIYKAFLILAEHAERCPFNEYSVTQEIEEVLSTFPTQVKE